MKKILGLDLGTNSIGWALIEKGEDGAFGRIINSGSRIIPMDAATMSDFDKGNTQSQTSERTRLRSVRRLGERHKLRRQRLNRVLSLLEFLPIHYDKSLDRYGNINEDALERLAWRSCEDGNQEFLFKDSFEEMVMEMKQAHPAIKNVSYDWTLYYLRKKALETKVSKYELAWILLSFLQKRGYNQVRGEEEETDANKIEEYASLKVLSVMDSGEKKAGKTWWNAILDNGLIYKYASAERPNWEGKQKDFIITYTLDKEGKPALDKEGKPKYSLRAPKEDDWGLLKIKTEKQIESSQMTVGEYIYKSLIIQPEQKIRGRLVRTIERKFYRDELMRILDVQIPLHEELKSHEKYQQCIEALYPSNEAYRNNIAQRNFKYLLTDDIIFYQRPLKSKKSEISDCPYEKRQFVDISTGEIKEAGVKCIARSNPYFQEFRIWQFIRNLKIYQRISNTDNKVETNKDITHDVLPSMNDWSSLYDWLSEKSTVTQEQLLKHYKLSSADYRWNYVEEKEYPMGETRSVILSALKKAGVSPKVLTVELEMNLWHILYSISDKQQLTKALMKQAKKQGWPIDDFVKSFSKIKPFNSQYGAYSEKAIKKLLPLMRCGYHWKAENIIPEVRENLQKYGIEKCQGLPVWEACYAVYNRHSESADTSRWTSPHDIDIFLNNFKQHSLRNPIVEQVVLETLRTVRDIWKKEGSFDEIHLELGRNLNQTAEQRKKDTLRGLQNEAANIRARIMLSELFNPDMQVENVRPYSPSQQEIYKIFEEGVFDSNSIPDDIGVIVKNLGSTSSERRPSANEILRYRQWLEQGYRSPYTGEVIPLSKLFTPAYQIEHVIPQSRYFNNSYNNKVICEAEVNQLKSNQLGLEFIQNHAGEIVQCSMGKKVKIFTEKEYVDFVQTHYKDNNRKMETLLLTDIPESFTSRQMNDSRYISKMMIGLLSNIVREESNGMSEEEVKSKNVVVCTGKVTDRLKKDWGLNDVWNTLITPRFERLNEMENSSRFGKWENKDGKMVFQTSVPMEYTPNFSRKRIDHRHHAMDAIAIACATPNIVNYLSNQAAGGTRFDLQKLLCDKRKQDNNGNYNWIIRKPWETFTQDARNALQDIIVSFKQNLRIINKTSNRYQTIDETGKRHLSRQVQGENWAIRKSLHKDTVFGEVNLCTVKAVAINQAILQPDRIKDKALRKYVKDLLEKLFTPKGIEQQLKEKGHQLFPNIDLKKVEVFVYSKDSESTRMVATRKSIVGFTAADIERVTDTGIQEILRKHLKQYDNDAKMAFSPEGIEMMNEHIVELNNGIPHKPIYRVRWSEPLGTKFPVGTKGNKRTKFYEADKGTNLFFAVYANEQNERSFESVPLNIAIERQKQGLASCPETNDKGDKLLFSLSPNDLVYVPTAEEIESNNIDFDNIDKGRIYKMVSCAKKDCFFILSSVAKSIANNYEFSSSNKMERALTGETIKKICVPIKVDRLGNILHWK